MANVIARQGLAFGYPDISETSKQVVCLFGPTRERMSEELWMLAAQQPRDGVNLHSDRWTGSTPHGKPANYASQLLCFSELSRSSGLRLGSEGEAGRDQGRLSCGGNLEAKVGQKAVAFSQSHR